MLVHDCGGWRRDKVKVADLFAQLAAPVSLRIDEFDERPVVDGIALRPEGAGIHNAADRFVCEARGRGGALADFEQDFLAARFECNVVIRQHVAG